MTTAPGAVAGAVDPTPARAVTRLALRQVWRGAAIVTALAAGMSAVVVATYRGTVGDSLDAAALAALAANPAIRTMFGEPVALGDPGGFTVWRTGTVFAVLLSAWAMLAATRITRGEEDAGRLDLLLAGRVPLAAVVFRQILVLVAAMATAGVAVAAALVGAGAGLAGAATHGAGLALVAMFHAAVGAVAAQVFGSRPAATGAATAVLGAGLLARMLGDGVAGLGWLRWLSPFGLYALTRAYGGDRVAPLLVLAVAVVAAAVASALLAGRRDLRAGYVGAVAQRPPRLRLLHSLPAFAVRRLRAPLLGWCLGVGAYFVLIGMLAVTLTGFLADNPRLADLAAQAGFGGLGRTRGYVASLFALLAIPAGLFTAVRVAAFIAAERDGRLTLLLARPLTRTRLLITEAAVTVTGTVVLTTVAGIAAWTGTAVVDAGLPVGAALAGAWNVLPVAVLSCGAAVLAAGVAPRAVLGIGALPTVGGFLIRVLVTTVDAPFWVAGLSPFTHLATVPDRPVNWPAAAVMTGIGLAAIGAGAAGYRRRDLLR